MSFDIADLVVAGPCKVTFAGQTIYSQGDVVARPELGTFPIRSALGGSLGRRLSSLTWLISFTPVGEFAAAAFAVTHPYGTPVPGTSLRTAADRDLVVAGTDGVTVTFHACGVWKQPDLTLSPDGAAFGEIQFRCMGKNNTDYDDAAKWYTVGAATYSGGPTLANILTQGYTATWGTGDPIRPEDAIRVAFGVTWKERRVNGDAIVDYTLKGDGLEAAARLTPANVALADYLALPGLGATGFAPGADLNALVGADLVITGLTTAWVITLKAAVVTEFSALWGEEPLRTGELAFAATRSAYNGALFSIAAPA